MTTVNIDRKIIYGKEIIVSDWKSHSHKECIHYFSDDFDGAQKHLDKKA